MHAKAKSSNSLESVPVFGRPDSVFCCTDLLFDFGEFVIAALSDAVVCAGVAASAGGVGVT